MEGIPTLRTMPKERQILIWRFGPCRRAADGHCGARATAKLFWPTCTSSRPVGGSADRS